jgi:hypothetical protein
MTRITFKQNDYYIDDIMIDWEVFNQEKSDYTIRDREDLIEDLCGWIKESTRNGDKQAMLDDLKYLCSLKDEFVFSSILTNEYIAESDDKMNFDFICREILKLNKEFENEEL